MGRGRPKGAKGSSLLRVLTGSEAAPEPPEQSKRMPCPGLWKTPVIRWDGELMACCADVDGEISVGNLRDHEFEDLWFGEQMNEYRSLHIAGRFQEIPKCWSCGGINFYKMSPAEIRLWLQETNHMELWPIYTERMGLDTQGEPRP